MGKHIVSASNPQKSATPVNSGREKAELLRREKRVGMLRLSAIRLDFQRAENLFEEIVQMYVDRIERGETLPSLRVRFDGSNYFLEDGFHRVEAARRCGLKKLGAEIRPGTLAEMETEFREAVRRAMEKIRAEKTEPPTAQCRTSC